MSAGDFSLILCTSFDRVMEREKKDGDSLGRLFARAHTRHSSRHARPETHFSANVCSIFLKNCRLSKDGVACFFLTSLCPQEVRMVSLNFCAKMTSNIACTMYIQKWLESESVLYEDGCICR
jgi:hypothetical protein